MSAFCSTHHSLIVTPWAELPGGVLVSHVDDPDRPLLLLRDRDEVSMFIRSLWRALADSERVPYTEPTL